MDTVNFKVAIAHAIEREFEAAKFYHSLLVKVKMDSSRVLLDELESMELKHAEALCNFDKEGFSGFMPQSLKNLNISEILVQPEINDTMTFQDVLVVAMKREEGSKNLYKALSEYSPDSSSKNLFLKLASEEANHKLQLETLYDDEINREN